MDAPDTCGLDKAKKSSLKAAKNLIGAGRNLTFTETEATRNPFFRGYYRVVSK